MELKVLCCHLAETPDVDVKAARSDGMTQTERNTNGGKLCPDSLSVMSDAPNMCNVLQHYILPVVSCQCVATMEKRDREGAREPYLFSAGGIGSDRFFFFFFLLLLLSWRLFQLCWPSIRCLQVSFSIHCTLVTHQEALRLACNYFKLETKLAL